MTLRKTFLALALTVMCAGLIFAGGRNSLAVDATDSNHPVVLVVPQSQERNVTNPPSTEALLYSNGPLVTHPGGGFGGADASALESPTLTVYGFGHQGSLSYSVTDDFTVTDAGGWTVDELCFYAYQTGSTTTSTFTQVDWTIWDGDPSLGGATAVCSGSATVGGGTLVTGWSGMYRTLTTDLLTATTRPIMLNTVATGGCVLAAGTYWVEWASWGTLASGPWVPPITILGTYATGDGIQNQAGLWVDLLSGVYLQGLPFEVKGTVNGGGGVSCGDIFFFNAKCNMNGAAQAMVKMNGDFSGETVTFDLDGDDYIINILSNGTNSIAKLTVPHAGMGAHTIALEDPAGCYSPVNFNCQVDAPPEWEAIDAEYIAMQEAAMAKVGKLPTSMGVVRNDRQFVRPPTEAVLYDQTGSVVVGSGYTSQDFEAAFDIYDNQGADDFVVPAGAEWAINQVTAIGVYYNGFGLMPSANVFFYADAAGLPGALVDSRPLVVPTSDAAGTVVLDFADVVLCEGTYWVSVQSRMDFGAGGQWGWSPNAVLTNSLAAWQNPGDGFVTGCTTWGTMQGCIASIEPDLAYILAGTAGTCGGGGIQCSDIFFFNAKCNMNGAAQAMVKMSGDLSGETVTFDLDGDDYIINVLSNGTNSIAKLTVPHAGMGAHTIALEDPAGCYSPVNFNCQVDAPVDPEWDALWAEYDALEAAALKTTPVETKIIGNYPNPFNPSTTIRYALSVDSPVSVRVYNMLGQEVATLVDGFQKAGEQSVVWHGTNNFGQSVASGLYIYRLQAGNTVMTQKMLFTK